MRKAPSGIKSWLQKLGSRWRFGGRVEVSEAEKRIATWVRLVLYH